MSPDMTRELIESMKLTEEPKKILLGVTASVAARKAPDLASGLRKCGYHVTSTMTDNALNFATEVSMRIASNEYIGREWYSSSHIYITDVISGIIIAPATANIIGKINAGIADDFLSTIVLALKPETAKIMVPAMNTRMLHNPVVARNIRQLGDLGWHFLMPDSGELVCGTVGEGKIPEVKKIAEFVKGVVG